MAKVVGYIKDFIEKKLKHTTFLGIVIRIPIYIVIVLLILILLERTGLVLDVILNEGETVTLWLRLKVLIIRVLFYLLPPMLISFFIHIRKRNLSIYRYLTEIQIFIIILMMFAFLVDLVSVPGEDNVIFGYGTGVILIILSIVIEYIEFKREKAIHLESN